MTVTVSAAPQRYNGNDLTRVFPYNGVIFANTDLEVTYERISDGLVTLRVLGTDYSVAGMGALNGGTVTTTVAVPSTHRIAIRVSVPSTQPTSIRNQNGFQRETHEQAFDRLTREVQKLERKLALCVRLPALGIDDFLSEMVSKSAFIGKYFAGDPFGNPIPASGTGNDSALRTDLASTIAGVAGTGLLGYRRNASGSSARLLQDLLDRQVRLLDFGADPTGVTDAKAAFDNAIAECVARNHSTLWVDHGMYRFASAPANIGYGIKIMGPGSQGSTEPFGTVFKIDFSGTDFLTWDGNGADFRGTGGGLENILVLIADTRSPNVGIKVLATNDNRRPGEMRFVNVLMFGTGTGTFSIAIHIDGRNCNTAGSRGVRTIEFDKVRVASCRTNDKYVHLQQVTHCFGRIDMDTGNGTGTLGMTIDSFWDHIEFDLRVGNVTISHTGTIGVDIVGLKLDGECNAFDQQYASARGACSLNALGGMQNASKDLKLSGPGVDNFLASRSATVTNQTGNGTLATMVADTEHVDINSSYDNTTGIFTAKCAGDYCFEYGITYTNLGAGNTLGSMFLIHRDSGATLIHSFEQKSNVGAMRDSSNQLGLSSGKILRLSKGDTVRVQYSASNGGADTVGLGGAGATRYSYISGRLLA